MCNKSLFDLKSREQSSPILSSNSVKKFTTGRSLSCNFVDFSSFSSGTTTFSSMSCTMNPFERRVIHTALQDDAFVTTSSEGEEPNRYVVISPVKKQTNMYDSESKYNFKKYGTGKTADILKAI